jgi:copper chaperone CopZ
MKKNITALFAVIAIIIGFSNTVFSQDKINTKKVVSDTLFVHGVCDMCKDRIENAALIKGVKKVSYDKHSHELVVFYKPEKVDLDTIEKEIAKAGHDTRNYKADGEVYNRLPECCAYRSGDVHVH